MTVDLVFLLALLVGFLTIAIGGLSYFLWRIFQIRIEADALSERVTATKTEIATLQGDVRNLINRLHSMKEHQ